ncbi:MAG: DUF4244 domain-containing protein [Acidimicrobiales bacterium]|nr:DUF4244 domain-containing protein [Acidimicrobiales bacterium]
MSTSDSVALALVDHDPPPTPSAPHGPDPVLRATAAVHSAGAIAVERLRAGRGDERGQSTAEYALVILGAAAVAALLAAWAGQTNKIGQLLDAVLDKIISQFR